MGLFLFGLVTLLGVGVTGIVLKRSQDAGGGGGAGTSSSSQGPNIRQRVNTAQQEKDRINDQGLFAMTDTQIDYAIAGAEIGTVIPVIGNVIGAAIGFLAGAVASAIGLPSYARIVRDSIADFNRAHHLPTSTAATDAICWRNALLGMAAVWMNTRTKQLAIEVVRRPSDGERTLGMWLESLPEVERLAMLAAESKEFIAGFAGAQVRQQIMGYSPGMLDGPGQRRDADALAKAIKKAAIGSLLPIVYVDPSDNWRTPGYLWLGAKWPRVERPDPHPIRKTDEWVKVVPDANNVDALAVAFDRAAGVVWS